MKRHDRIEVYKGTDGYRWRYRASNGRIVGHGGQGYSRRIDCILGLERITGGECRRIGGRLYLARWVKSPSDVMFEQAIEVVFIAGAGR